MADITKCSNGCSKKEICYRWNAVTNVFWQSYSDFKPNKTTNECEYYWHDIEKENK